jgi:hypothetical protein
MAFERVYMVWDIYDGVRSGIADYRGRPHYFDCALDPDNGGYADAYELWPIDRQLLALATERWALYRAWERRFHSGEVPGETHPGHRGQNHRYDELGDRIDQWLKMRGPAARRALAEFRACADQRELPYGCLREVEVEWADVA